MRILIVDDSRAMRMIITRGIRQAGYSNIQIDEAASAADALDAVEHIFPDIILSDWNMPGMTGLELLKAVKAKWPLVKFVFITAEGTEEYRRLAVESGAAAILSKPFTTESLKLVLDQVLG